MAVGGAEAPGAGAANVVVADNTPPANAVSGNPSSPNATGQGSAGSPGGLLPPVSTQPERRTDAVQAGPLPPDAAARIGKALIHLNEAENKLVAADRSDDEPTEAKAKAKAEAKAEANREVKVAERDLSNAIRKEAEKLSRPSPLSARHSSSRHDSARHASAQRLNQR